MMRWQSLVIAIVVLWGCGAEPASAPGPTAAPAPLSPASTEQPAAQATQDAAPAPRDTQAAAKTAQPEQLLILPLAASPEFVGVVDSLDELLLSLVQNTERYQVLGSHDLNVMYDVEKLKDMAGCDDVACVTELAGALDACYVLSGRVGLLDQQAVVSLHLMDTHTGQVLARASAQGGVHGKTLSELVTSAVEILFNIRINDFTGRRAPDYSAYSKLMTDLGKLISTSNYSAVLEKIASLDVSKLVAPEGTDPKEAVAFYRVLSSFMLKHKDAEQLARSFLKTYPDGLYVRSVESFVDQIESSRIEQEDAAADLEQNLADIEQREAQGHLRPRDAEQQRAYVYLGAKRFDEAASRFQKLLAAEKEPDKRFDYIEILVTCLERAGRFDDARRVLDAAEKEDARRFRQKHMQMTLRRLPR